MPVVFQNLMIQSLFLNQNKNDGGLTRCWKNTRRDTKIHKTKNYIDKKR